MSLETILLQSLHEFLKILPFLILAVIAGKIIECFIPTKVVRRFLGKNHGGIFIGTFLGLVKPGPLYVTLPILNGFMKKGMSFAALSAYLTSELVGGFLRFFIEVGYFGIKYSVLRIIITLLMSIGTGYIFLFFENRHFFKKKIEMPKKDDVRNLKKRELEKLRKFKDKEIKNISKIKKKIIH